MGVWGASPQRLATLGIYCQNNPFLSMFQLKFCLNIFETCLLLNVCILKFSILAIILFEYLLLDPSARGGPNCPGAKKFQGCTSTLPLTSRAYGPPTGVTLKML